MNDESYKHGDIVKVWSLQSFSGGGFLEGVRGIVAQDQIGASVIVAVPRIINGERIIDPSYEVYAEQLELVSKAHASAEFLDRFDELLEDITEKP